MATEYSQHDRAWTMAENIKTAQGNEQIRSSAFPNLMADYALRVVRLKALSLTQILGAYLTCIFEISFLLLAVSPKRLHSRKSPVR